MQQILPSLNPVFLSGCMVFPTLGLQFLSLECDFQIWTRFLWKYVHFDVNIVNDIIVILLQTCC